MLQRRNRLNVLNATAVKTSAPSKDADLTNLGSRPNGLYAYAYAIAITLVLTIAETGTGQELSAAKLWQALASVHFSYNKHTRANGLSGLNILRLAVQGDEIWAPEIISKYIATVAIASQSGTTTATLKVIYPLAPGFNRVNSRDQYTGLVPISELEKSGVLKVAIKNATNLTGTQTNYWSLNDSTGQQVIVDLLTVELPRPVEHVYMYEEFSVEAKSKRDLPGDECLISALMCCDDEDSAFTLPDAFSVTLDGEVYTYDQDGDDWVDLVNISRYDGINDIMPAVLPIVCLADRGNMTDCMPVYNKAHIENAGAQHSGSMGVLVRYSRRIPENTQRSIQGRHGIDRDLIDLYVSRVGAWDDMRKKAACGLAVELVA